MSTRLKVTVLGSGTPYPDPERWGPSILVEAGGKHLLFDCGRGAVVRLTEAGGQPKEIDQVFLTHLHSDHITGLPDLLLTGWFLGRRAPLNVSGPAGTRDLARHLAEAFHFDVQTRVSTEGLPAEAAEINAQDLEPGTVYDRDSVRVTAFLVDHGPVRPALGYRVDYSGHSLVISGDTRFSQNLVNLAKGADCIIHAAWSVGVNNPTPRSQRSIASAEDAARVFSLVQPRLAVVDHYKTEEGLADAIRANYKGPFVIANDLMTIVIDRTITGTNGASSGTVPGLLLIAPCL